VWIKDSYRWIDSLWLCEQSAQERIDTLAESLSATCARASAYLVVHQLEDAVLAKPETLPAPEACAS
jgi:hypothetical protein